MDASVAAVGERRFCPRFFVSQTHVRSNKGKGDGRGGRAGRQAGIWYSNNMLRGGTSVALHGGRDWRKKWPSVRKHIIIFIYIYILVCRRGDDNPLIHRSHIIIRPKAKVILARVYIYIYTRHCTVHTHNRTRTSHTNPFRQKPFRVCMYIITT